MSELKISNWAPGEHIRKCVACGMFFAGDKRATNCLGCGAKAYAVEHLKAEMDRLAAENERLREALESTEAWLERWAVHVGRCEGGHRCTCGLTAVQYEGSVALAYPAPGKEGNTND